MSNSFVKLADFAVIRQLTVGPVVVEPHRVKTEYRLRNRDGRESVTELIYSFDEAVFDPDDPSDINLACLMTAQVALNYGLFCERLEFDGLFDESDQRFLTSMLDNTSREIYLNKLLASNVFLVPTYQGLSFEKRKSYTQAEVHFTNTRYAGKRIAPREIRSDINRSVVLSSGGKDSLLTYGLLRELNHEAHPIFVNEAGRHWLTAMNAYRHLSSVDSRTARVWCNSDRVFSWMLRHLPLIRDDFADVRADYYPIRLWTVAVFIFGAIPLARKRGLSRILVGNEYDTTQKTQTHGITNYNSLYDQSIYFDRAMSRFYERKKWGLSQLSLLRSLSELLILKILAHRYPDLQRHQVSCHAAHSDGQRAHPCGRCEKCRRICGMLTALGYPPQTCGYTDEQVQHLLEQLSHSTLKQYGTDLSHLYWMLRSQDKIGDSETVRRVAKPEPQTMCLRFDSRSELSDLIGPFGDGLVNILVGEAEGVKTMRQHKWHDLDLSSLQDISQLAALELHNTAAEL